MTRALRPVTSAGVLPRLAFGALWLFIFTLPWERSVAVGSLGALGKVVGVVALLLGVVATVSAHSRVAAGLAPAVRLRAPSLFLLLMVLFALWLSTSALWSANPSGALKQALTYVQLVGMVWLIWQQSRGERARTALLRAYVLGSYVAAGAVVVNFVLGQVSGEASRYSAFGDDANYAATSLALALPLAWQLLGVSRRYYWLYALFIPTALLGVGLTGSRGGFIVSVIALCVIPLTYHYLSLWRKLLLFGVLVTSLYGVVALLPETNLERLAGTTTELTQGTLTSRRTIWRANLSVIAEHPLIGVGSGGLPQAVAPVLGYAKVSHNGYLTVLGELGLIGFGLFAALFITALLPLLTLPAPTRSFALVLWLALVVALMPVNWEYEKVTWFVLALLTSFKAYVWREPRLKVAPTPSLPTPPSPITPGSRAP